MKTGKELIDEIDSENIADGELCYWWLGQHSFVVKTANRIFYLDPFLSDHSGRQVQSLLKPPEVTNADIITGSHDHTDHIDRKALPEIMAHSPESKLIIPQAVFPNLENIELPGTRIETLDDGMVYEEENLKITAIKSAHEFFDREEINGYPYLGFIIEADGVIIYHSGDTCKYEGLEISLKKWRITVAFLPINGRDARRLKSGCIGNMTYQEAVDLAGSVKPALTVPTHFEMFAGNTENPQLFTAYMEVKYPDLRCLVPEHGQKVKTNGYGQVL